MDCYKFCTAFRNRSLNSIRCNGSVRNERLFYKQQKGTASREHWIQSRGSGKSDSNHLSSAEATEIEFPEKSSETLRFLFKLKISFNEIENWFRIRIKVFKPRNGKFASVWVGENYSSAVSQRKTRKRKWYHM